MSEPQLHDTGLVSSTESQHILNENCWCKPTVEHVPGRKPAPTTVRHTRPEGAQS